VWPGASPASSPSHQGPSAVFEPVSSKGLALTRGVCLTIWPFHEERTQVLQPSKPRRLASGRFIRGLPRAEVSVDEHCSLARVTPPPQAGSAGNPVVSPDRDRAGLATQKLPGASNLREVRGRDAARLGDHDCSVDFVTCDSLPNVIERGAGQPNPSKDGRFRSIGTGPEGFSARLVASETTARKSRSRRPGARPPQFCATNRLARCPGPGPFRGSFRNPVVHSLSVTLGNHTILGYPPYNDLGWLSCASREVLSGEVV